MMRVGPLVFVVLASAGAVALAQPNPRQEAADHFKKAEAAAKAGRHQEAIDEYLEAYTLVPHVDVLYNIAFNYEKLEQWARAVEFYQRYLDERDTPATDAEAVTAKIRDLRTKIPAERPKPKLGTGTPNPNPGGWGDEQTPPKPPPIGIEQPYVASPPRWHGGISYGLAFGDAEAERYLAHAGLRVARFFEADAVLGSFGKNDYALGVMGRIVLGRASPVPYAVAPFLRGTATIGYAKQDASSSAKTKLPLGFEAGGGVQIGARGRIEIDAVMRWTVGGWDAASTTADSYVNDGLAFAIDLGLTFDFALPTSNGR